MNTRRARVVLLTVPLLAFGVGIGCLGQAEHTYFDDLLDGSADGTTSPIEASPGLDASTGDGDVVMMGDDGGADAADDVVAIGDADVVGDAGTDAMDAAAEAAPIEAGCGPTNTAANCGACGASCDTAHSTAAMCVAGSCTYSGCAAGYGDCTKTSPNTNGCETPLNTASNCTGCGIACDAIHSVGAACATGSTCTYSSCKPGWSMCNTTAPNVAGCSCNTPGCCDGGCETVHTNGVTSPGAAPYYDCVAPKTYTSSQAFKACAAYTDAQADCSGGWMCFGKAQPVICDTACTICWVYGGAAAGQVQDCSCPGTQSGTWN